MNGNLKEVTLANGVSVAIEDSPSFYSASLGILAKAGSKDEGEKKGVAHLLEHLVFKGNERFNARRLAEVFASLGGEANGLTHKDYTLYYLHMPYDKLLPAFEILADVFLHPLIAVEELEKEKQVVLEEIKEMEDSPEEVGREKLFSLVWRGHPLSFPILGWEESVRSISRGDILDFLKRYYTPDSIIISASGRIDPALLQQIEALFGDLRGEGGCSPSEGGRSPRVNEKPLFHPFEEEIPYETIQSHIYLALEGVPWRDDARYVYDLLATILGGGASSRLFQKVREEKGLAYEVDAENLSLEDGGLLVIYSATDEGKKEEVLGLIREELEKICEEGIGEEELRRGKEQLKGMLLLSLESTVQRMGWLASTLFYKGSVVTLEESLRRIEEVTAQEIQEVMRKALSSGIATLLLSPR